MHHYRAAIRIAGVLDGQRPAVGGRDEPFHGLLRGGR
jgi:hypothetical protein